MTLSSPVVTLPTDMEMSGFESMLARQVPRDEDIAYGDGIADITSFRQEIAAACSAVIHHYEGGRYRKARGFAETVRDLAGQMHSTATVVMQALEACGNRAPMSKLRDQPPIACAA